MMGDADFDQNEHRRALDRYHLRHGAKRDGELRIFRRIWDVLTPAAREDLTLALYNLASVQDRILKASEGLLAAPNVATATQYADEVAAEVGGVYQEVARLRADVFIVPGELLCAMACWSAGEDYIPEGPEHPRWPFADERERWLRIKHLWDNTEPAKDDEGEP